MSEPNKVTPFKVFAFVMTLALMVSPLGLAAWFLNLIELKWGIVSALTFTSAFSFMVADFLAVERGYRYALTNPPTKKITLWEKPFITFRDKEGNVTGEWPERWEYIPPSLINEVFNAGKKYGRPQGSSKTLAHYAEDYFSGDLDLLYKFVEQAKALRGVDNKAYKLLCNNHRFSDDTGNRIITLAGANNSPE